VVVEWGDCPALVTLHVGLLVEFDDCLGMPIILLGELLLLLGHAGELVGG
jgi:hypothetical protein